MEINTTVGGLPVGMRQSATHTQLGNVSRGGDAAQRTDASVAQSNPVQESPKAKAELDKEVLEEIVSSMQESVNAMQRNLNFTIHDMTGMTVVKVMDAGSGELIRQMPTDDALRLAERLDEMRSLLFEAKA